MTIPSNQKRPTSFKKSVIVGFLLTIIGWPVWLVLKPVVAQRFSNQPEIGRVQLEDGQVLVFEAILDEPGDQYAIGNQVFRFDARLPFITCIFRVESPDIERRKQSPFAFFGGVMIKDSLGETIHDYPNHNTFHWISPNGRSSSGGSRFPKERDKLDVSGTKHFFVIEVPFADFDKTEQLHILGNDGNAICNFPFPVKLPSNDAELAHANHDYQANAGQWSMELTEIELVRFPNNAVSDATGEWSRYHELFRIKRSWEYDRELLNESDVYRFDERLSDDFGNRVQLNAWSQLPRQSMWRYAVKVARSEKTIFMKSELFQPLGTYSLDSVSTRIETREFSNGRITLIKPNSDESIKFENCDLQASAAMRSMQSYFLAQSNFAEPFLFNAISSSGSSSGYGGNSSRTKRNDAFSFGSVRFKPEYKVETHSEYEEGTRGPAELKFNCKLPIVAISLNHVGQ